MTLPSSGPISLHDINVETRNNDTFSSNLNWVKTVTKPSYRQAVVSSLSNAYGFAYYQKSNESNCNNGNCTANCNCGNIQCTNCVIVGPVNCVNCDDQQYLQPNCNCACTYNCLTNQVSYNCACACACACACDAGGWG